MEGNAHNLQEIIFRSGEDYYKKMVEEIVDYAIFLLDENGIIRTWNKGAERIKGYTSEEIIGTHFRIFYTQTDCERGIPEKLLHEAIKYGRTHTEGWRVRKDGSTFWASIVITALHDDANNVIGFTKITKDLTDRKLIEDVRQLDQKNKELEQLVYITSHDLKEPLSSITGFARILERLYKERLDENGAKYLHYITESCHRMNDLIKALLDYSLIGRQRKLEEVNCNNVVNDVLENLYSAIHKTDAKITVSDLPVLKANTVELELLFQNLIGNAIKFHRKDISPNISVKAYRKDDAWEFVVSDNGIGIDDKFKERIFHIFQRLHGKKEFEGMGIGLSYCKKIVNLYGGQIWVESNPDHGSTFHFTIPE